MRNVFVEKWASLVKVVLVAVRYESLVLKRQPVTTTAVGLARNKFHPATGLHIDRSHRVPRDQGILSESSPQTALQKTDEKQPMPAAPIAYDYS